MARQVDPPENCPVCGASVPLRAAACPGCGADERTGWDEESTRYDDLDLPESGFDQEEVRRDNGLNPRVVPRGVPVFWWLVGVGVLVGVIVTTFGLKF